VKLLKLRKRGAKWAVVPRSETWPVVRPNPDRPTGQGVDMGGGVPPKGSDGGPKPRPRHEPGPGPPMVRRNQRRGTGPMRGAIGGVPGRAQRGVGPRCVGWGAEAGRRKQGGRSRRMGRDGRGESGEEPQPRRGRGGGRATLHGESRQPAGARDEAARVRNVREKSTAGTAHGRSARGEKRAAQNAVSGARPGAGPTNTGGGRGKGGPA